MGTNVAMIDAVRTSIEQLVRVVLDRREPGSLLECPRCGDRIISLDVPMSYALDGTERICRPCRAQIELTAEPDDELGGES